MKNILFLFLLIAMQQLSAQTIFNYNMLCAQERYYESDSNLLLIRIEDSLLSLSHFDQNDVLIAHYTGHKISDEAFFLKRDDDLQHAEIEWMEDGSLNFTRMSIKGEIQKIMSCSKVLTAEMYPIDYKCYTAYRPIYFDTDYGKDSVSMFIQRRYPVPTIGSSKEDSLKLIEAFTSTRKGLPNDFSYPEDIVKNADIMMVQDYTSMYETGEMEPDYSANWEINDDLDVVLNAQGLLGMINSMFEYTGGAHGVYASICNTYDFTTKNIVAFDDMFSGNYEAFLIEQINSSVKMQFELEEGESLSNNGFFEDSIPLTDNFCLKMKSILFIYNIYEIAPYLMGAIEVEIPYNQLTDYIRIGGPIDRLMKKSVQD